MPSSPGSTGPETTPAGRLPLAPQTVLSLQRAAAIASWPPCWDPAGRPFHHHPPAAAQRALTAAGAAAATTIRQISFPLTWVADELLPEAGHATPGMGPSAYMGSQGAHAVGASGAESGMRMISRGYWRALVPARRAVELQRVLDQLPRDLDSHLSTHLRNTPAGQQPSFQWVNQPVGAMDRPFTVQELQSIPDVVRRFNTNPSSVTPAELALVRRAASLHVGDAMRGRSPFVSWSRPPSPGQPDPVGWANQRRFRVRAEFNPRDVLDNIRASQANTLTPGEVAQGFEPPLNAEEAEFLAMAERDTRVLTVEPLAKAGAVKGELVPGSARWMAQNAAHLRWAGRGLIVVSLGISAVRIASASEANRAHVIGQEAGAHAFGIGGAVLAGAACVALGVATGGVGLFLCGMAGGLLGGLAGSAVGGATADALNRPTAPNDPFNLLGPQPGQSGAPNAVSPVTGDLLVVPPEILDY